MKRDLLSIDSLSTHDIDALISRAIELKKKQKAGVPHQLLKGKTLGLLFEKPSTRTRVSFEVGMVQLGGHSLYMSSRDTQLSRKESPEDTARVLSRYLDGLVIRTFSQEKVRELASYAAVPVINGLTDIFHPCQALADFFTIYEMEKDLTKIKLAYIGDGNNVAHSLMECAALIGSRISIASPENYQPQNAIVEEARRISTKKGARIEITSDIEKAVAGAHYLYTDVWASMGQENEISERKKIFADYRITMGLLEQCARHCRVMHCLPAHKGEEIDEDVFESKSSIIFEQAENRLHVQKAIMVALMA